MKVMESIDMTNLKMGVVFKAIILSTLMMRTAEGYANGAPVGIKPKVCHTMLPGHDDLVPMELDSYHYPLSIEDGVTTYTPGWNISVKIGGDVPFLGFLLIAKTVLDDEIVGTFSPPPPNTQLKSCNGTANNVVTHSNTEDKVNPVFIWHPPDEDVGEIQFRVTVARIKMVVWTKVNSTTSLTFAPVPTTMMTTLEATTTDEETTTTETTTTERTTTPTPTRGTTLPPRYTVANIVAMKMTLNKAWNDTYSWPSHPETIEFKQQILRELRRIYSNAKPSVNLIIQIRNLRPGSVVVYFDLQAASVLTQEQVAELAFVLEYITNSNSGTFTIDGTNYPATLVLLLLKAENDFEAVEVKGSACFLYNYQGRCENGGECAVNNSLPVCDCPTGLLQPFCEVEKQPLSQTVIYTIIGVVGGLVILVIIVVACVLCQRFRGVSTKKEKFMKKKNVTNHPDPDAYGIDNDKGYQHERDAGVDKGPSNDGRREYERLQGRGANRFVPDWQRGTSPHTDTYGTNPTMNHTYDNALPANRGHHGEKHSHPREQNPYNGQQKSRSVFVAPLEHTFPEQRTRASNPLIKQESRLAMLHNKVSKLDLYRNYHNQ